MNQYSRRSNNDMFICDVCIDNLRKANIFKNQIEESQKRLNLMTRRQKYIDRISSPLPAEFDFDDGKVLICLDRIRKTQLD